MTDKHFAIKFLTFFLVSLFFSGCEKENNPDDSLQEVVFGIHHIDPFALKTEGDDIPECPEDETGNMLIPTIADIVLENAGGDILNFTPQVFYLNGNLYSQAIKLPPGTYTVEQFLLREEVNGTIIMATPSANSAYAAYITTGRTLGFSFEVKEFEKSEVQAEVLCFEPSAYTAFGFHWYNIHQTVVKNFCFFGDICLTQDPVYQEETAYGGNTPGSTSNPWWFYFAVADGNPQNIFAGQYETDGTVSYDAETGYLNINLGSWDLQQGNETVKINGYSSAPVDWEPPGSFQTKTNQLSNINVGENYNYFIIHLDIEKHNQEGGLYNLEAFEGSLYEHVVNGLQIDVPAIFRIDVEKNGQSVPYSPFSNVDLDEDGNPLPFEEQTLNDDGELYGTNQPVCAKYPVNIGETGQEFTFALYLWVPGADGTFAFELFHTFTATDDGPLINQNGEEQTITNGFLDFVLGDCNYYPPDLLLDW